MGGITTSGSVSAGNLTVDNINIDGAVITSNTGAISFGDENLSTSGGVTADSLTSTYATKYEDGPGTAYHGLFTEDRAGSVTGTCVIDLPTSSFENSMLSIRITGYNYSSAGAWSVLIGGYAWNTVDDTWLNHHASIQGNPPFTSVRLGYNGNTGKVCIMLGTVSSSWGYPVVHVAEMIVGFGGEGLYQIDWDVEWYTSETNFLNQSGFANPVTVATNQDFPSPTVDDQVLISTASKIANWQVAGNSQVLASDGSGNVAWLNKSALLTDTLDTVSDRGATTNQTLTVGGITTSGSVSAGNLTVDNINIDGATITSNTGAISFSDENVSTSGTTVGSNIPSPTVDDQVLISTASGVAAWSTPGGDQYLATNAAGDTAWADKVWTSTLSGDMTIYVRTTGNDSTGDGSPGTPYLTLAKVVKVIGKLYIGSYTVTVDIGEGVFLEAGTLAFIHPFGQQVNWQGVSESITAQSVSAFGGTSDVGHSGLYYQSINIILPVGKSVSIGDFIGIRGVTGGTNPNAMIGVHYVSGWVGGSRTATIQRVYNNGSETPSGAVSFTVDLIKTVISFSNKNGIKVTGPYSAGVWRGMVLKGDYNGSNNSDYGVWALNGSVVSLAGSSASGDAFGVQGFKTAIYAQNNGLIFADYAYMSKGGQHLCSAQNGGILGLRYTNIGGAKNSGIYAFNGSTVAASNCTVVGTGDNSVISYQGSFVNLSGSFIGESDSTTSLLADRWACIDATGATADDAISPSTDGDNDGSYVIGL